MNQLNLTNEEIIAKMQQAGQGTAEYNKYAELLLTKNKDMVASIAYKLADEKGYTLDDVTQELNIVMLRYAKNYNEDKGMNFSTYFFNYAPHYAKRFLNIYTGTFYGIEAKKNVLNNDEKDSDTILNIELEADSNLENLPINTSSAEKKLRNDRVMIADQYAIAYALSLDKPIEKMDDLYGDSTMMDFIVDPSPNPMEKRIKDVRLESIDQAMTILPKQLNDVIHKHYIQKVSKTQIGSEFGVSHEMGRVYIMRATEILKEMINRSSIITRIQHMKRAYQKYTKNSTTYPQHFLSNLPYTMEEIFEAIDYSCLKYFHFLDIDFEELDQSRKEWIKQFDLKKSYFAKTEKANLDLYFDILFHNVDKSELVQKYQVPQQAKMMRKHLYEVLDPFLSIHAQTCIKPLKIKSKDTEPTKLEEKLILFYKKQEKFYNLEQEIHGFSSQQQLILKCLYGEQLSVEETAEKLNLSRRHIAKQKKLMLITLTFALQEELQSLDLL